MTARARLRGTASLGTAVLLALLAAFILACGDDSAEPQRTAQLSLQERTDRATVWVNNVCPLADAFAQRAAELRSLVVAIDFSNPQRAKDDVIRVFEAILSESNQYHAAFSRVPVANMPAGPPVRQVFLDGFLRQENDLRTTIERIKLIQPSSTLANQVAAAQAGSPGQYRERVNALRTNYPDTADIVKALETDPVCAAFLLDERIGR